MPAPLAFRYDESRHRFVAELDGAEVAFSEVDVIMAKSFLIKHTEVASAHEGRGYGTALMRHILGEAREQGRTVIPICPFAKEYVRRHPEYLELVRPDFRSAIG